MHDTLVKFGYPDTLIHEGRYWSVLLRPQQATLGALVLVCNENVTQYSQISPAAFVEQGLMVTGIETMLTRAFGYQRINYMMLMMVEGKCLEASTGSRRSRSMAWSGLSSEVILIFRFQRASSS